MNLLSSGILAGALSQVTSAALGPTTLAVDNIVRAGVNALTQATVPSKVINPSDGGSYNGEYNRFLSTIRQLGVMRTNLFFVTLVLPSIIQRKNDQLITYLAESVNLPGVNLGTTQNRRYGFGTTQKYVNDVTFNDLTVSFICDAKGAMLGTFGEWMNKIVRFDAMPNQVSTEGSLNPSFFEYKDNYIASSFIITVVDETRDKITTYEIMEAFPTQISDISLNWGTTDELARFTVNFSYTSWKQTAHSSSRLPSPISAGNSLLSMSFGDNGSSMSMLPLGNIASGVLNNSVGAIGGAVSSALNNAVTSNVRRLI